MPEFDNQKMERDDCEKQSNGNVLAMKWHDKRDVCVLSTIHMGQMVDSGKKCHRTNNVIFKPDAVVDYVKNMRLVDKSDMMIGSVECMRKSIKWYKKLFFHLVDVTMLNAFYMYKLKTKKNYSYRKFVLCVVDQLIKKYSVLVRENDSLSENFQFGANAPNRLTAKHYIEKIPVSEGRKYPQRMCFVCKNTKKREQKRKDTRFWCKECQKALCIECFRDYHSSVDY
jgi:hypothetical protein